MKHIDHPEEVLEDKELTEQINESVEQQRQQALDLSTKRAKKHINKHKREIKRLNELATNALLDDNKASYVYAITKIRAIINKPITKDVMESMWLTSRERLLELVDEAIDKVAPEEVLEKLK